MAPPIRRVNMLTGEVANERFFQALSEADHYCRELDTLRELQTRNDELTDRIAELSVFGSPAEWDYCPQCGHALSEHSGGLGGLCQHEDDDFCGCGDFYDRP